MQMRVRRLIMPTRTQNPHVIGGLIDRRAKCSGGFFDLASPHLKECMTRIITVYATFSECTSESESNVHSAAGML